MIVAARAGDVLDADADGDVCRAEQPLGHQVAEVDRAVVGLAGEGIERRGEDEARADLERESDPDAVLLEHLLHDAAVVGGGPEDCVPHVFGHRREIERVLRHERIDHRIGDAAGRDIHRHDVVER